MSTTPVNPSADLTTLEAAQANMLASTKAQCALLNDNLKFIYMGAFNSWKANVDAGRIDNTNPPQPPKSYIPVEAPLDAEGLGQSGWFFPEQQGPPVCDLPALPESQLTPKPALDGSVTVVGPQAGCSSFYSCPAQDTNKPGTVKQIPFPDGTVHKLVLLGTPFGRIWEDEGVAA